MYIESGPPFSPRQRTVLQHQARTPSSMSGGLWCSPISWRVDLLFDSAYGGKPLCLSNTSSTLVCSLGYAAALPSFASKVSSSRRMSNDRARLLLPLSTRCLPPRPATGAHQSQLGHGKGAVIAGRLHSTDLDLLVYIKTKIYTVTLEFPPV